MILLAAFGIESLVSIIVTLVVLGCIVGLLHFLIQKAPIPEPYKGWIIFVLVALVVLVLIGMLLQFSGIYNFRGVR